MSWNEANHHESNYWDRFMSEVSTFKYQEEYLTYLRIYEDYSGKYGYQNGDLDFDGKKILDVGGGPVSILLRANGGKRRQLSPESESWSKNNKVITIGEGVVIDPVIVPDYVKSRYEYFNIKFINDKAEKIEDYYIEHHFFDECIIYNCLQHVEDPILILNKVSNLSKKIRICEPINIPTDNMHLHTFTTEYFQRYFDPSKFKCVIDTTCFIGVQHYLGIFEIKN